MIVFAFLRLGRVYSPAEVVDSVPCIVLGNPDRERICTSHRTPESFNPHGNAAHDAADQRIF